MMGREEGDVDKVHGLWETGGDVSRQKQEGERKE
jgi:hypothetical protein